MSIENEEHIDQKQENHILEPDEVESTEEQPESAPKIAETEPASTPEKSSTPERKPRGRRVRKMRRR